MSPTDAIGMDSSVLTEEAVVVPAWEQHFQALTGRIAARFARAEARESANEFLQALLSSVERKNGWQIAEHLGEATPYGVQHLLDRAKWEADLIRDDLQRYVIEHLCDAEGVLVVDETGFLKKGDKSAGVARQYSGTAGRIENSQIGVFLGYASSRGHALIDRALYLPREWTENKERCGKAAIPDEVVFMTKPKMARQMLERAFDAGVPARWVTGDALYGNDRSLQLWLQERKQAHVLAVSGQEMVTIGWKQHRVKDLLPQVPEEAWQILSAGAGAKGPRLYQWACLSINCQFAPQWKRWLLVRRSLSDPKELTGYIAFAPADTRLATLAQVAGTRWTIESCFEAAKGEVGLDHYEVRSWHGWHRHITLSMLAHACLSVLRATQPQEDKDDKKGLAHARKSTGSLESFKLARGLCRPCCL